MLEDRGGRLGRNVFLELPQLLRPAEHQRVGQPLAQLLHLARILELGDVEDRAQPLGQARVQRCVSRQQNQPWTGRCHEANVFTRGTGQILEV